MRRVQMGFGLTIMVLMTTGALANSTVTLQDREQAACYGDVQALCGEFVPDVDKVTSCMLARRDRVSPGCAKYFPTASSAD